MYIKKKSTKHWHARCKEEETSIYFCNFSFFFSSKNFSVPVTGHHTMDEELENKL